MDNTKCLASVAFAWIFLPHGQNIELPKQGFVTEFNSWNLSNYSSDRGGPDINFNRECGEKAFPLIEIFDHNGNLKKIIEYFKRSETSLRIINFNDYTDFGFKCIGQSRTIVINGAIFYGDYSFKASTSSDAESGDGDTVAKYYHECNAHDMNNVPSVNKGIYVYLGVDFEGSIAGDYYSGCVKYTKEARAALDHAPKFWLSI